MLAVDLRRHDAAAGRSLIGLLLHLLLHFQHVLLHFLGLLDHVHIHAAAHHGPAPVTAFCHCTVLLYFLVL